MRTGTKLGFAALLLAVGTTVFWFYQTRQVDLPGNRLFFVASWLTAAVLAVSAYIKGTHWSGGIVAVPALIIGLFLPFTVSISPQGLESGHIEVGDKLPEFSAPDMNGQLVHSDTLAGNILLIKFFRAHW